MNIQLFLTGWLIAIIVLCFIKLKWAVALFIAYIMLVPYINLGLPGLGTGDNLIRLIMLLCCCKEIIRSRLRFCFRPLIPFLLYFMVCFLLIPFQDGVPMGHMLTEWRKDAMNVLLLPIIIWNLVRIDSTSVVLFRNVMIVCIVVSIGYGLYLTTLGGWNPYTMYFLQFREDFTNFESYYEASGQGRLFGRISSVYIHPMNFALFIGLAFIYLYSIRYHLGKIALMILLCSTFIMAIVCGVRSVLGGLLVALIYYLLKKRSFKLFFSIILIGIILAFSISFMPDVSSYLSSMSSGENVRGSSIEMRLEQLEGAFGEASKSPLSGLGYKWTDYYQSTKGDHPVCLAFESLIFVIICNSGLIGVVLWIYLILSVFSILKRMKVREIDLVRSLLVYYISYSMITGEYGYMKTFLIFYILMLSENCLIKSNNI